MTEEIVAPVQTEETVRAEMPEIIDSTPTESAGKKEKFYGIELLRILATFYIILLHIIGRVGRGRKALRTFDWERLRRHHRLGRSYLNIAHLRGGLRLLTRRRDLYAFRPCFVCAKGKRDDYERGQERAAHR